MKNEVSFFRCKHCGNIVALIKKGGGTLICCGEPMDKLEANTTEAAVERHIPVSLRSNGSINVEIGSVPHPMVDVHYIEWVAAVGDEGVEIIYLHPGDDPKAILNDKKNVEVYAYCNIHGLWKGEVK